MTGDSNALTEQAQPSMTSYVGYVRVSTTQQGTSGLGLEAQEATIRAFLKPEDKLLTPIMVEVESGRKQDRPVLQKALHRCRVMGAALLVAKLDRLARNRAFVGEVLRSGVQVVFCDLPASQGATGRFLLGVMAEVAELEAGLISERTKAALVAAKARGVRLGGDRGHRHSTGDARRFGAAGGAKRREVADTSARAAADMIAEVQAKAPGASLNAIARMLNAEGASAARGGAWTATAVRRVLERTGTER